MKTLTVTASLNRGNFKVEIDGSNKKDHAEYTGTVTDDGEDILIDDDAKITPNRDALVRAVLRELLD